MELQISDKNVLLASIISRAYLTLLFSHLLDRVNYVFASIIVELFTIPMILIQGAIIVYMLYWIFIQKKKISLSIAVAGLVSIAMVILIVNVK